MSTKQFTVIGIAFSCIALIFLLGSTKYPQKSIAKQQQLQQNLTNIDGLNNEAIAKMQPAQKEEWNRLQTALQTAKSDTSKVSLYEQIAHFSEKQLENEELTAYYYAEKVKLENSQKNLTFAANFILRSCISSDANSAKISFRANIAKELFEKALQNSPQNDSLKIGLGGSYMYGASSDNPMKGTLMVLDIVKKDSTNAFAHKMLGYGGLYTGQTDKAIERFIKAYTYSPADSSLVPYIALLSKELGKVETSKEWYNKTINLFAKQPGLVMEFKKQYEEIKNQSSK